MKKTLALVLALAMVFSTITVAFAEGTLSAEAQICADLGMLKGSTGTVDAAYTATAPTRIQAAVMFLRLKGLEAEATAFTGEANFADADKAAWAKPIMAYLKANPQLGWQGDGTNFDPAGAMTAQAYYKVMLEALGYKQTTPEVVGDFAYADVMTFAASKGLTKLAEVTNFTVNDLAVATVETLKANMKDGGKTLVATLVEAGKVDASKAEVAGLVAPAVATLPVVDEVEAVGSTVVDITFEEDVDASAANVANYAIEGLTINSAALADTDRVRLETAPMSAGKLYTLTVGEEAVKYTGIAKVSGAPEIKDVESQDIEEVVITFTKNIDLATGSDVANYSINGIEIAKAVVDGDKVTLTTVGLVNKTKYTVKVTNVKSIDGTTKKSTSDTFTSKFDVAAPKIATAIPETNQRLVVTYNEDVTEESAENLANYSIKVDEKDGAEVEIISVEWDFDGEDTVAIVTEPLEKNEDYVVSVNGIVDQRKAANTLTRPDTEDFEGADEDEDAPKLFAATALSPTSVLVTFTDKSRIDEASATDLNNYDMEDVDIDEVRVIEDEHMIFRVLLTVEGMDTGKSYDLTVDGVADEFGNAIDEDDKPVRAKADGIGAIAPIADAIATGENTIVIMFDGELDEASAENIANYEIDEDLGAPTKAVYAAVDIDGDGDKDQDTATVNEKYCVTLTVNDMVNGFTGYDLTIDGVLDLAGNKLFYEMDVDTADARFVWDETKPELEDVELLNNKVVALTFDEKVEFESDAELMLAINDADGNISSTILLGANDYDEDDTVVEFAYDLGTLDETVEFSVYKIVYNGSAEDGGIKDLIGNRIFVGNIERADFVFDGTDADDDPLGLEYDSIEQIDGKTFQIVFPREVEITDATADANFTASYESDGVTQDDKIRLTKNSDKIEEKDYDINIAAILADLHGVPVANDDEDDALTTFAGEYKDEEAPYIDEVVATSRETVEITFNERINESTVDSVTADFLLWNYDLDEKVTIASFDDVADNDGVVVLKLSKPLEARYEYSLTIYKTKVKDIVGNDNDTEEVFYFDGTNLKLLP